MAKGSGGPRLGCGSKFMKITLILFNLVFFLLGIAILAIGIYVLVDPKFTQIKNIANSDLTQLAQQNGINLTYIDKGGIAFCVFGSVMLLISFMGCCGACKQVKCLLGMYSFILLLILLAEIAVGIFVAVYSSKLKGLLTPFLQDSIRLKYMGDMTNKSISSIAWDAIMYNFECCGVLNYTDFSQPNNVWIRPNDILTPRSCCKFKTVKADWSGVIPNITAENSYPGCYSSPLNSSINNFQIGCYDRIESLFNQYSAILIGIAIGIGLVLLIGVVFGFYLCKRIGDMDDYV